MIDRLKVGAEFCGWPTLTKIVSKAEGSRDKLLILTLFKTGGRVSEVLDLTKSAFDLKVSQHSIVVRDMSILKKFQHTKEGTVKIDARRSIPVLRKEVLSDEWGVLLSKLRHQRMFYGRSLTKPMSRINAYMIVRDAGKRAGVRVSDHWFRGMRASQLAEEYGFGVYELNQFFGWGSRNPRNMAERYAALGWRGLEKRMMQGSS